MMTTTEQALRTFDRFITDWTPPAMNEYLFGHKANAADGVRRAILGIVDQRALALRPGPLGYGVFSEKPIVTVAAHLHEHESLGVVSTWVAEVT